MTSIPMLMNFTTPDEHATISHGPTYYYVKYGAGAIISFLLYLYFYKGNVRAFFSLSEQEKWKPVVVEFGICIGIAAVVSILTRLK